jgi:hypothetical protein
MLWFYITSSTSRISLISSASSIGSTGANDKGNTIAPPRSITRTSSSTSVWNITFGLDGCQLSSLCAWDDTQHHGLCMLQPELNQLSTLNRRKHEHSVIVCERWSCIDMSWNYMSQQHVHYDRSLLQPVFTTYGTSTKHDT